MIDLIGEPDRSDQPTTADPTSVAAGFPFLQPTPAQRVTYHTIPRADSIFGLPLVPDLGSLHCEDLIEIPADRWDTTSSAFPSMDPFAMLAWNEEREVKVPNQRRTIADNVPRFHSGLQHRQLESARHHPFYILYLFLLPHKYSCAASAPRSYHKRRRGGDMGYEHDKSWSNRRAKPSYC